MDPNLFFNLFPPIIFFNAAFDMDVYMLQKLLCQVKKYSFSIILFTHETLHFAVFKFLNILLQIGKQRRQEKCMRSGRSKFSLLF